MVDYVLTITVSIAGGGNAIFSFLPPHLAFWKLPVAIGLHASQADRPEHGQVVNLLQQYLGDGNTRNIHHKGITFTEISIATEKYRSIFLAHSVC